MPRKVVNNDIRIAIIHDSGQIGLEWKTFIEELFTEDLPEDCRDMGLDITCESMDNIYGKAMSHVLSCEWKLFILSPAMLQALQDDKSTLYRSELLDTNPDKNIVLVLGGDDASFVKEVRRVLAVFPDFASFHIIHATSTEKIFNDVISVVSPLYIVFHPNILSSEEEERQHITLIATKAYPHNSESSFKYYVEFADGGDKLEAEATLFNPYTLLLENPGHSPGMVEVSVYYCPKGHDGEYHEDDRVKIGEPIKVWYQSALDKVHSTLEKSSNPFDFLCQALNLKAKDGDACDAVDKALTKSFEQHIPDDQLVRVFGNDQSVDADHDEGYRKEYAPTLLHFAAMYGLRNLTALLLRCPGSVRAYGTANCDGDYPTNLAEKAGHWDLKDYMKSYMEVSAILDYELGDSQQTSHVMSRMVTGNYLSLSEYDAESCYESIASTSNEPPPGYLRMKPLRPTHSEPSSYDAPFIVPIPLVQDSYESMLNQVLGADDETYASLGTIGQIKEANKECDLLHIPPVPPRDDPVSSADSMRLMMEERGGGNAYSADPVSKSAGRVPGAEVKSYESLKMPRMVSSISPAQQELVILQQRVKTGELTTNQAIGRFKEWERKHKEQAATFQFQQECLQRIRMSLTKSREMKRLRGESDSIEITGPITAGSSTYDRVLKKTGDGAAKEACYGEVSKARATATSLGTLTEGTVASHEPRWETERNEMASHQFDQSFHRRSTRSRRKEFSPNVSVGYSTGSMTLPSKNISAIMGNQHVPPPVPPRDQQHTAGRYDAPSVPPRSSLMRL